MPGNIHPTALIEPGAQIDSTATIGPYCVIGPNVRIGAGTQVGPHCVIDGHTEIGRENRFYRFCSIGGMPQDKKYADEPTRLVVGDRNTVREYVTFNTGTVQDGGVTTIGSDNWVMAYVHVAHDCHVGSHTILANSVQLGGHVHVGDWAIIGGLSGIHQFCKIGAHSMTGGNSSVTQDIPPFMLSAGNPCAPRGINAEGLKRRGYEPATISALREAYKNLYLRGLTQEAARQAWREQAAGASPAVVAALDLLQGFIDSSTRGLVRP